MKARQLQRVIEELCFEDRKMAFVSGPRQCGKTTLARMIQTSRGVGTYYNWDDVTFRRLWTRNPKEAILVHDDGQTPVIIFDEIHKAKGWKRTLKGLYDTLPHPVDILVTGSARLNVYRKGGDSLLGRYYHFRMHPFSLREMDNVQTPNPDDVHAALLKSRAVRSKATASNFEAMMQYGTFPEPLLAQNERKARLWRRSRRERVIREDLRDLTRTLDLSRIEMLAALIPERVGSPVSVATYRDLLEVGHTTVTRWLNWLKEVYYVFELKPYSRNVARSLKKEGKFYMWDPSEVPGEAARFENLVACHLLRACHFWTDTGEGEYQLFYLRNKERQEIDFLITRDGVPWLPVEAKLTDDSPSPNWRKFLPQLPCALGVQVCKGKVKRRRIHEGKRTLLIDHAADILYLFP